MSGGWRALVLDAVLISVAALLGIWAVALVAAALIARHVLTRRDEKAAAHDPLTGLPNRARLSAALDRAGDGAALLMIDLDGFKAINDTQGHLAGDRLLATFADRLREAVAPLGGNAMAARLGGDEFAVLVTHAGCDRLKQLAAAIVDAAAEPVALDGRTGRVRASIGIARRTPAVSAVEMGCAAAVSAVEIGRAAAGSAEESDRAAAESAGGIGRFRAASAAGIGRFVGGLRRPVRAADDTSMRLLREADLALYEAKRRGKGQFQIFDSSLSAAVEEQRRLEAELGGALATGEFEVVYQPVVDLPSGARIGVEALVRWRHPRLGTLEKEEFEAAAASCGVLPEVEGWLLRTALAQQAEWRTVQPRFGLFIHLSAGYLRAGTMAADIGTLVPGTMLAIRISDTAGLAELVPAIGELRELGALVALDGFGTGRSPLGQLRELPISAIKLDRQLLSDLDRSPEAVALLGAVIALVGSVGLDCVAGGVESPEQAGQLRRLGCRRAVGPVFGTATPASEIDLRRAVSYA